MRHRWLRPLFGPMRRKAHTGVPADHFLPARQMLEARYGDGRRALVADGIGVVDDQDTDPAVVAQALDAVIDALEDAVAGGNQAQANDLIAAADVLADKLLVMLGGIDADEELAARIGRLAAARDATAALAATEAELDAQLPPESGALARLSEQERRRIDGSNEITDPEQLSALVASAFDARGGLEAWSALRERKGLTASVAADGTITPAAWHAYLCAEGVRTDDGRELMLGSCRNPDLPVSMRLLVEDEGGHWGAVTCGRIDSIEPLDRGTMRYHLGDGMFGSDPNGQLAELMVEEQTQRFVSIDPRDATAEWIEYEARMGDEYIYDCWLRITDCVIGAATIVAMPALPQAVITLADVALPEAPLANASAPPGLPIEPGEEEAAEEDELAEGTAPALAASGAPAPPRPAREWMDDPNFRLGDARMVLQADEVSYACPLTVEDPDPEHGGLRRAYGHVAWWNCDHTAFPGERQKPPHSPSGYAYYNTGPAIECSDGSKVAGIGNVTMGCGHAPMFREDGRTWLSAQEAIAHYDGGYGAKQVFAGRCGEDEFGPWFAGYVRPGVTDEELAEALTLNMSGDWREIAGELELVAVLLVPVPGFPLRRAMAASGQVIDLLPSDTRAAMKGDRVLALVAAGIVRRVDPLERLAHLELLVVSLTDRLTAQEKVLRPLARQRALDRAGL